MKVHQAHSWAYQDWSSQTVVQQCHQKLKRRRQIIQGVEGVAAGGFR